MKLLDLSSMLKPKKFQNPLVQFSTFWTQIEQTSHCVKCDNCGYSFVQRSHLEDHINGLHLKGKPFECSICETAFARKGYLKIHTKNIHEKS